MVQGQGCLHTGVRGSQDHLPALRGHRCGSQLGRLWYQLRPIVKIVFLSSCTKADGYIEILGSFTIIFATIPSSCASTSMWALSVSISRRTSPAENASPTHSNIISAPHHTHSYPFLYLYACSQFSRPPRIKRTFLDFPATDGPFCHSRTQCWHVQIRSGIAGRSCSHSWKEVRSKLQIPPHLPISSCKNETETGNPYLE